MSRIRLLSEQVANQIAAGEVVDRPAAVVKELAENSLDAGADRVGVEIEGTGLGLIRVSDNGCGMDQDDALLCLERHATSKLRDAAELMDIRSLGFRGEAMPSIASVSWMEILTRQRDSPLGVRVEVRNGVVRDVREEGAPLGTVIEVRRLFANVPARKKFLKSARTELSHMEEAVKNLALAHPKVAFRFVAEGRVLFDYPTGEDAEERLRRVFRYEEALLQLGGPEEPEDNADSGIRIAGSLLAPEKTPSLNAKLRLFVNNRAVQDNMLRFAVREAMQGYLMRSWQPAGMVQVILPPQEVDVNVHPAKREIRFRQAETVRQAVTAAVARAMRAQEQGLRDQLFRREGTEREERNVGHPRPAPLPTIPQTVSPRPNDMTPDQDAQASRPQPAPLAVADPGLRPPETTDACPTPLPPDERPEFAGLRLIGQLFALYLLCERPGQAGQPGQLVVIDQHAAHERILFGRMAQNYLAGQAPGQTLLFPETVELSPRLHEILEARLEEVQALGFGLQFFGETTWVILQVPALTSTLPPAETLGEVLETLSARPAGAKRTEATQETGNEVPPPVQLPAGVADIFASLSCKAAIKAGRVMAPEEMLDLLARMEQSRVFSHCPHGRPVVRIIEEKEVEQWFHRKE